MNMKNTRHFLCGLLLGASGMYWYTFYGEDSLDSVATWLQREADEYRANNPTPEVDTGWRPRRKQGQ